MLRNDIAKIIGFDVMLNIDITTEKGEYSFFVMTFPIRKDEIYFLFLIFLFMFSTHTPYQKQIDSSFVDCHQKRSIQTLYHDNQNHKADNKIYIN